MSELKITGTIKLIGEKQTFDSGFEKVEFVITTDEQYPQEVKLDAIKEKADNLIQYNKVGDKVDVKFNVRGSYNEPSNRYFVNLQAWHVQKVETGAASESTTANEPVLQPLDEGIQDLPF